ncbi:MAG: hypothetical protein SWH61_08850 [Thermodesulfobacteriota bacterium]|nr:hypothetical protein [Thermodesulfobacteriota bacterium]
MISFLTKTIQRVLVFFLYTALVVILLAGSIRLINYSLCQQFYRQWLMEWENALNAFSSKGGRYPVFANNNHREYMTGLCIAMADLDIAVPSSNTRYPFTYRYKAVDLRGISGNVFLLGLADRIVIYGMPERLFEWIDKAVDGRVGMDTGRITGRKASDQNWTGVMQL